MKQTVYVDPAQFAAIKLAARDEEIMGIDPGVYWARRYPGATEVEFIVTPDGCPPSQSEEVSDAS